jgi:hypothetical protein
MQMIYIKHNSIKLNLQTQVKCFKEKKIKLF